MIGRDNEGEVRPPYLRRVKFRPGFLGGKQNQKGKPGGEKSREGPRYLHPPPSCWDKADDPHSVARREESWQNWKWDWVVWKAFISLGD